MRLLQVIIAAIIISSCSSKQPEKAEEKQAGSENMILLNEAQQKNAAIQTGALLTQPINETILLSGLVDVPPQNIISISFPLGGYLKSTKLLPGMHVAKGESIAIVQDQSLVQLQQDYLMARAKLKLTKLDYQRQQSLNETKTAADKVLQQAQAEYESSRIMVMGLAEKLRLININPDKLTGNSITRMVSIPSPINGFVSKVNVNIGKYVQPQDVLFELINPSDIHAALTVFEKDLNKIVQGQKVQVSFVDEPEIKYDADVILVTKNIDENRSGIVHCHFEKMPENLKPGMFINATLNISNAVVKVLPEDAVVRFENKEYVFVVKGKEQFEAIPVITGKRSSGFVQIISTIDSADNTLFVTKNAFTLLSVWKNVAEE